MTTATAPPGGHSTSLGLMSCVRESSPQDLVPQTELVDIERNETSKKRRFHPFRGLRKIFRRGVSSGTTTKVRSAASEETVPAENCIPSHEDTNSSAKDSHRSRSTSELLAPDELTTRRKSGVGVVSGGMYTGGGNLSVSHDSVFTAEQHSTRGDSTSSDLDTAQSSSSLSIQQLMQQSGVRAELLNVVRRRGRGRGDTSEDEEDLGLPRSPCNSPTTIDKALKEHPTKSHSTCSDGSLLSMGSSEMDEDSFGQQSRHSSKLSLHDRRTNQGTDSELEFGTTILAAPLSHSAARHKMAVKPKRTHGAPRRRRIVQQLTTGPALPTTPEVNEEVSTRSLTPEGISARETIAELYSSSRTSMNKAWNMNSVVTETQLKSASLPPGLALPSGSNKLSRSRSNTGKTFAEEEEDSSKEDKKKEESFFGRFLARRSGKKKKYKSEDSDVSSIQIVPGRSTTIDNSETITTSISSSNISYKYTEDKRTISVDSGISKVARSGPAARQRIQPIDIPASPDAFRQKRQQFSEIETPLPPSVANSPEQSFLEASPPKKMHIFLPKQTKVFPEPSTSSPETTSAVPIPLPRTIVPAKCISPETIIPPTRTCLLPPSSPPKHVEDKVTPAPRNILSKSPPKLSSWADIQSSHSESKDEGKTKVKITGLSSYQQRVLSYSDDLDGGFKSLEETSDHDSISSSITKSQSFRSRSILTSSQEHSSLPYSVNTNSDSETFTDSLMSTAPSEMVTVTNRKEPESIKNDEIKIINTNSESKEDLTKKTESTSSSVFISTEKAQKEEGTEGITISCVNSQMQASVNTKSTNQVVVSISSSLEPIISDPPTQVSVTKVQLKRESISKPVSPESSNKSQVPEFLKIQLNKVDAKPSTNIVLTTSNSFSKADEKIKQKKNENEEKKDCEKLVIDMKRKFSSDDVEIFEKESLEEVIEVPFKNKISPVVSPKNVLNNREASARKSLPLPIPTNNNNSQLRKSSLVSATPPSPTLKPFLKKKSSSLELDSIKLDEKFTKSLANSTDQLCNKSESNDKSFTKDDYSPTQEVVMRKKSVGSQKRDKDSDEPELMKVFARRSLKLKDSEAETLSQQVMVLVENDNKTNSESAENMKRDSDKENECSESPVEERKKTIFPPKETNPKPKEPLTESKFVETTEVTLRKPSPALNNKLSVFGGSKFQRGVSLTTTVPNNNESNDDDKKRNKSYIEPKTEKKPVLSNSYKSPHIINIKEKDIEITKKSSEITKKSVEEFNVSLKNDFENEDFVPRFKRIQQRKEEWEKRAQQNMQKSVP